MRFPVRSFLAALAALAFASPAAAKQTVKIGAALSMTGPAAAYGANQKTGVQAAVDEVNQSGLLKEIVLEAVIEDDASDKAQGIAVFQKLMSQAKVSAIIGPTLSNTAFATNPLAQAQKVPVVAISNTAPKGITDIGDYIWRVSLTEAQVIPGALKTLQAKLGFKKAAVLYGNDDAFTKAGYDVMKAALADQKIQVMGEQTFAKPDRDYNAQLTALIAQKPEILVVSALIENASGIVAQARQLGWTGPIFGGNGFNNPVLMKNAGPAAEGVYVGTAWNRASTDQANQKFLALMKARGVDPDQFCAQAYTGVLVVAEAIKQAGMKGGRDDIKAGFAKVKDLPTPLGKFSFLPNRDGDHTPAIQVVKDGKFQILQ
jgi:branched-chain amino acid transport system substrate-binding protein